MIRNIDWQHECDLHLDIKAGHRPVVAMCLHHADDGYNGHNIMTPYRFNVETMNMHVDDGVQVVQWRSDVVSYARGEERAATPGWFMRATNIPANPVAFLQFIEPYKFAGLEVKL